MPSKGPTSRSYAMVSESLGRKDFNRIMVELGMKIQLVNSAFKSADHITKFELRKGGEDYIITGKVTLHSPDLVGEVIRFGFGYSAHPDELTVMNPKTQCVVSGYDACLSVVEEAINGSLEDFEKDYVQGFYDREEQISVEAAKFASEYHVSPE